MKVAALDAGSHSFHLIVAEVSRTGTHTIVDRQKEIVRIGEGTLRTRVIPDDGFSRGLAALAKLRKFSDAHGPDALLAVATEAIREAKNGAEFVKAARKQAGVELRTVTADEEARLVYLGARKSLDLSRGAGSRCSTWAAVRSKRWWRTTSGSCFRARFTSVASGWPRPGFGASRPRRPGSAICAPRFACNWSPCWPR